MTAGWERRRIQAARNRRSLSDTSLLDFIPAVSPQLVAPAHLAPAVEQLEGFRERPFEFVFSVPPRHGKTVLVLHFVVWALKLDPTLRLAYITYAQNQAEEMSGDALRIAMAAGLRLSRSTRGAWETPEGGRVL